MILSPERLKASREAIGLSRQQLADKVGVTERTIRRAEQGLHGPRSDVLGRLACALGVSIDSLFVRHAERSIGLGDALAHPPNGGDGSAETAAEAGVE